MKDPTKDSLKIMFMGTPEFAEMHLRALIENGYNVCCAVTQPDKPKGRGYVMTPPPVKEYAQSVGITVYQPEKLRDGSFEEILEKEDPNLIAVVAYGKILPKFVLDFPKYGCINIHGSLLPKYRGAAPMQRVIINGEKETGVCSMYMDEGMDTGDILEISHCDILENDNFENIHDKLAALGAENLLLTIDKLCKGELVRTKQDDAGATYAAKIEKEDCMLDFSKSVNEIHDRIRGLSPFPLAYAYLGGKSIKVVAAEKDKKDYGDGFKCGEVASLESGKIHVRCADGFIALCTVLPEGKGRMRAADFINGRKVSAGDVFVSPFEMS